MIKIIITIFFLTSVVNFAQNLSYAQPSDSLNEINSRVIKAENIIEKYLAALGGRKNLARIRDRKIRLTGAVQNVKVKMVIYQKVPNKYYQKVSLGTTEQKTIFNGKEGYKIIDDSVIKITGNNLEKLKYDAAVRLMGLLDAYDVESVYLGKEIINGHAANEIKLLFPSGMEWTQFYNDSTGLKVKELKPVFAVNDTLIQKTFFENYKEVNGIKYPFEIRQSLGAFYYEFKVDSIKINTGLSNRNFELEE